MTINKYPDGSSYAEIHGTLPDNQIIFRVNSYEDLWHLNQYIDAFNNCFKARPKITIPCLIDSQADRRFGKSQSSGLKLVCKFLNNMSADFKVFHPHNYEVVEALMDNVKIIDNSEFIRKCLIEINRYHYSWTDESTLYLNSLKDNLILMSSDAGGFKPLMKLCDKINWQGETFSASKARLTEHSEPMMVQRVDREDFQGKDILIVDDICVYGGTFKGLSKLIKSKNCGKLYLSVSHMTVQNLGENPVTNYFDKVFTTNSKYDNYFDVDGNQPENLDIIKSFK
jgi:ribose-phosphate pyrophosphokinase